MMDYINAFWVGGLICALVQILMEKTKMMPGRIMVLLVCLGGSGSQCSAAGIWKYTDERGKRSGRPAGPARIICRRVSGRSGGDKRSSDLCLSGKSYF